VISTVMLVVYAAQPLTPRQAVESALLALAGGLLQTGISVALWPVWRYEPERRAPGRAFSGARARDAHANDGSEISPATAESLQAQNALAGLSRDESLKPSLPVVADTGRAHPLEPDGAGAATHAPGEGFADGLPESSRVIADSGQ